MPRRSWISPAAGCAALALLTASGANAQSPRAMTAAERQRSCAAAEGIWAALEPVMILDARSINFDRSRPIEVSHSATLRGFDDDFSPPPGPGFWTAPAGASRGAASPAPALNHALFRQWLSTPETSIFECKGFDEKQAAAPSSRETTQQPIFLSVALPTVSSDGLSALVYTGRSYANGGYGFTEERFFFYLTRSGRSWRVVGVGKGRVGYLH